jgi:hypothetical protein
MSNNLSFFLQLKRRNVFKTQCQKGIKRRVRNLQKRLEMTGFTRRFGANVKKVPNGRL